MTAHLVHRVLAASSLCALPLLTWVAAASAEAPLCALAPAFERELIQAEPAFGAAVYELDTGSIWSGGDLGPYALHSTVKPPIAWAVLTDAHERKRELSKPQQEALFYMVAWSRNADVGTLLSMIGGLAGLNRYYERWGVPELAVLQHAERWGTGRAAPADLARLYAALALSSEAPEPVREKGLDLLRAVVDQHRWGGLIPAGRLIGWEALIKTGNYALLSPRDEKPSDGVAPRGVEAAPQPQGDAGNEEPASEQASKMSDVETVRLIVRMNSVAIWLDAPWHGSRPRYVVAIMQETQLDWADSRAFQNRIGDMIANAIADRIVGKAVPPSSICLKRALY